MLVAGIPGYYSHAEQVKTIIESIATTATVDIYYGTLYSAVQYALDNGYALVNRSSTGLSDSLVPIGDELLNAGGLLIHAHGSNNYEELNNYSSVQSIVAVRDSDGSYGDGVEFTTDEPLISGVHQESWSTPNITGHIAQFGLDHPTLTYTQIRQAIRDTASNGGIHDSITGYGTPDWDAAELAMVALES